MNKLRNNDPSLISVWLNYDNRLTDNEMFQIAKVLTNNTSVTILHVKKAASISTEAWKAIAESLGINKSIDSFTCEDTSPILSNG